MIELFYSLFLKKEGSRTAVFNFSKIEYGRLVFFLCSAPTARQLLREGKVYPNFYWDERALYEKVIFIFFRLPY
ncbi:MAG: hypothetical protein ACI97N_000815 [Cognaticolwellia sp.]|jgi:hypothetical protein